MKRKNVLVRGVVTPANIIPYVEALGVDDAVRFFLALGGSTVYLPRTRSSATSAAASVVGAEKVLALSERMDGEYIKVPLARQWTAKILWVGGETSNEIARKIRVDVSTVHRYLNQSGAR